MSKTLQDYVKYTRKELDTYAQTEGSCVHKINRDMHFSLGAYCLEDFKGALAVHIARRKVGFYDNQLDGIVLDIKNVKVLGTTGALRTDDSHIHININADCYVFRPVEGAEFSGVVRHVGEQHVGAIIYRVFSASIHLASKRNMMEVELEQEVRFRVKNFNVKNVFPYIEGELLQTDTGHVKNKKIKSKTAPNETAAIDSGIEKDMQELDDLIALIKEETAEKSPTKETSSSSKDTKTKRKRKTTEPTEMSPAKIKIEPKNETTPKKRSSKAK